jgi:hypothetical protein
MVGASRAVTADSGGGFERCGRIAGKASFEDASPLAKGRLKVIQFSKIMAGAQNA